MRTIPSIRLPLAARALVLGGALAASAAPLAAQRPGDPMPMPGMVPVPMVVTTGRGEVEVTPDRATVQFAVESRGSTAAEAGARNARIQTAVLDTLKTMGFTPQQLGTTGYSVSPEYQYPKEGGVPKVVGYVARNTIRADVRKIDQVGPTIDAALAKGATNVAGLRFDSSRIDEIRREALKAAVRNARADAEAMAEASGGALGDILDVSNAGYDAMPMLEMAPMRMAKASGDMAQTPIEPGELKLAVSVTARWRWVPAKR